MSNTKSDLLGMGFSSAEADKIVAGEYAPDSIGGTIMLLVVTFIGLPLTFTFWPYEDHVMLLDGGLVATYESRVACWRAADTYGEEIGLSCIPESTWNSINTERGL